MSRIKELTTPAEVYDLIVRTQNSDPAEKLPKLLSPKDWPELQGIAHTSVFHPVWLTYRTRGNAGGRGIDTQRLALFKVGYKPDSPTYVLTVGCDHEFEMYNLGNCYNEYRCKKCDFAYRVDSSD